MECLPSSGHTWELSEVQALLLTLKAALGLLLVRSVTGLPGVFSFPKGFK